MLLQYYEAEAGPEEYVPRCRPISQTHIKQILQPLANLQCSPSKHTLPETR
jgi:hypothetical protein